MRVLRRILHIRKPDSVRRTWAFLIAACILYFPANILPVMVTTSFPGGEQQDTIMSGIIYFWVSGSWVLAAIIFIASFLVPLFKLAVMMLLLITVQRRSSWRLLQRAKLFRVVEVIGRWSMLDVFVVSLLTGPHTNTRLCRSSLPVRNRGIRGSGDTNHACFDEL